MKIKSITASCRKTINYQSFEVSLAADLEGGDNVVSSIRKLQSTARKHVIEQINIERTGKMQ